MQELGDNIYVLVIIAMIGAALLVVSFILHIIYNSNKLLKQKRKLQEAEINYQKELLYAVIESQEKERQRIGMDLHDEVGSTLSCLKMLIDNFKDNSLSFTDNEFFFHQSKSIIDEVIKNVRNISHDLAPFGNGTYDFINVLEDLQEKINQSEKIILLLDIEVARLNDLGFEKLLALYRIITELIHNTLKHAQASHIKLLITENGRALYIKYIDNGVGLGDIKYRVKSGIGMRNIESRLKMIGAQHEIINTDGNGFEIIIALQYTAMALKNKNYQPTKLPV